jgi:CRISPR/Cas system-associated exonuclease Cas4 (RecB family)
MIKLLRDQDTHLATPDPELVEAVYESFRAESRHGHGLKEKGDKKRDHLWATDIRYCPRKVYYDFTNPSKAREYTVKGLMLMEDGNLHHKDIQRRLEERRKADHPGGFLEDAELGVTAYYDDLYIVGHKNRWLLCDILEIKRKFGKDIQAIDQADYDQLQYYIWMAQFSKWLESHRIRILGGRLLYSDRAIMTDEVYSAWRVEKDEKRIEEIRDYIKNLKLAIAEKTIPRRPFERESLSCVYCRYNDFCWRGIPTAVAPAFSASETAERPEKELVDSMALNYIKLKKEAAELEKQIGEAREIIKKYFAATGLSEIPVGDKAIVRSQIKRFSLDAAYLFDTLPREVWTGIVSPDLKKMKAAIKDGSLDPEAFERSKVYRFEEQLRIKGTKEEDDAL